MSHTLEPTKAERDTAFWRSFNPLHWVGVDVYTNGGGGGDNDDHDIGGKEVGEEVEPARVGTAEDAGKEGGEEVEAASMGRAKDAGKEGGEEVEAGKTDKDDGAKFEGGQGVEGEDEGSICGYKMSEARLPESTHHGHNEFEVCSLHIVVYMKNNCLFVIVFHF